MRWPAWAIWALVPLAAPARAQSAPPVETKSPLAQAAPADSSTVEEAASEPVENCHFALPPLRVPENPYPPAKLPQWLPHYALDVRLDTECRKATTRETIRWTNPGDKPTDYLLLHVYPRHCPSAKQMLVYERIIESFRLDPKVALDSQGRRIQIDAVRSGNAPLSFSFDAEQDTVMRVDLPQPVAPGETIEVEIDFVIDIPPTMGRVSNYLGITTLANWYPIVAYYGKNGWDAVPFVGWHQPWLNEAGNYDLRLSVRQNERVATGGKITHEAAAPDGWKTLDIAASGLRDLALVVSKRFEVHEAEAEGTKVQIFALPEHRFYARLALQTCVESIPIYNRWFGRYPQPELKIAESVFGWNGNETAGMVLIDYRVFDAPKIGHMYVDHLVSHEVCHQWWYGTVGTDGFRETWMDEGLVSYINELKMHLKYGTGANLLDYPRWSNLLPNVDYDTMARSGYYYYRYRGGKGNVLAPLTEMGHVHNLFFLAYDRGSKVFGMIHHRLGDEKFFGLLQKLYHDYSFRILFVCEFQKELEEATGASWDEFFADWLKSSKITDWKIAKVGCHRMGDGYETRIRVQQRAQIDEPVDLGLQLEKDGPIAAEIPIVPEMDEYAVDNAKVRRVGDRTWEVIVASRERPRQIVLDPYHRLLDANLRNNRWKLKPEVTLTPLYTPLDEVPISRPLGVPSFRAGPGIDYEGRLGIRGSLIEPYRYRVSPFLAYSQWIGQTTVGIDSEFFNVPLPNLSLGGRFEHTLMTGLDGVPLDQGRFFLRWNQIYTSSYIYPNLAYAETYFRFGDNFFPMQNYRPPPRPGVDQLLNVNGLGIAYHLDTRIPYWNPAKGFVVDALAEHGFVIGNAGSTYNRVWSQVGAVHTLPEGLGYFSDTRLAARLAGGLGSPDNAEQFRFGGPYAFRGLRSYRVYGSDYWLSSLDWRFPLYPDMDWNIVDNIVNWRSLYASLFYDVGEAFLLGQSQGGIDHAIGVGLYFRLALLSFLEQLTLRVEIAHSIRNESTIGWFGMYQAY